MKRAGKSVALLFAIAVAGIMAGCGATEKKSSAGEFLDDTVITTKVKTAILNEPRLKVGEIKVETFKGVVQLSGFVGSQEQINKAVEVAKGVTGVTEVKNNMVVKGAQ